MKRWLFLLLFFPVVVFGQFRMVSSTVTLDSTVNDSTYIIDVDFFSDQTAKGYFASGITADYRVFSQTGQLYDITAASNLTLSSGELTIVEIDNNYVNTESAPVGQILVFDPQGDYITFTPFGNSNMGQVLQQAIGTYNAVVSAEGGSVPEWSGTANYEQFKQVSQDGKIYTNRTGTNTTTPPSSDLVNWELTNKSAILEEIEGRDTISQASHPFSVGDPLWYSGNYILARDTGASVRVDGIVVEVIDANTFVRQRSGKFTLSSHGFTENIQLYVQPDGSYSSSDTTNSLVYGYAVNSNEIKIGLKDNDVFKLVEPRTFEFSKTSFNSITRAKSNSKTWVVSDTVSIFGNLNVSDLDIIFEKNGFIQGADTITASGATIQANKNKQLWSNTTVIEGNWNVDKSYMEWTIGSNANDSIANYQALKNAVELGDVILAAKEYPIAAASTTDSRTTDSDIHIYGVNRNESILRLITKHRNNSIYDDAYFRSDNGNNVILKNFTLTTADFENNAALDYADTYPFIRSRYTINTPNTKPNIDYIIMESINMKGFTGLGVAIDSTNQDSSDYVNNFIDLIDIKNCFFEGNANVMGLIGMRVKQYNFTNNIIHNTRSNVIGRASGPTTEEMFPDNLEMKVYVSGNKWRNDSIIVGQPGYLSSVAFQGGDATFENNYIEGLISSGQGTETVPWYYSGSRVVIQHNTVKNVYGKQGTYVAVGIDLKNNLNQKVINNKITLDKQVFVDIGLLDSLNQNLSSLTDTLAYQLIKINPVNNTIKQRELEFSNNVITVPFVSYFTATQSLSSFDFKNNTINIEYLSPGRANGYGISGFKSGGLLYNSVGAERNENYSQSWISSGNVFNIQKSTDKIYYNTGEMFSGGTDTEVAYSSLVYNDTWNVDSTTIVLGVSDTESFTNKSIVNGNYSSIEYDRIGNSITERPPAGISNSEVLVSNYGDNETFGFALNYVNSIYKFNAKNNSSDTLRVFKTIRNDALYQNLDSLPLEYELKITGVDTFNQDIKVLYRWFGTTGRGFVYRNIDGDNDAKNGDSGSTYFLDTFYNYYLSDSVYLLLEQIPIGGGQVESYFKVGGMSLFNSFAAQISIKRTDAPDQTEMNNRLNKSFTSKIYSASGKELTLESAVNPYGGSNEIGDIINDMATADGYATIASGNTITRKSVMYVDASLESTATLTRSGSGIPTNTDVIISVKNAGTVTISDSGGANLTFNDPNIADKSSWVVGPGEYVFRWLPNSWIAEDFPDRYYDGWADYTDTTYTSASPLSLTASTKITLPNRAQIIRDSEIPIDIDSLFSIADTTITGRNGDGLNILIEFKVKPTTAAVTKITVTIDIGGTVGEIYPRDFMLTKGNGVEHYYISSFGAYTLDTWETNGGKVKIVADAAADIYDIRYVLTRTHKAKY